MPTFVHSLLHRLLLVVGPSALIACGGRGELETPNFENGGSAGTNSICGNPNSIPRVASSDPDEERFDCGPSPSNDPHSCVLQCYVPGPSTIPGSCASVDDPALEKLPVLKSPGCGFDRLVSGPYCDQEAEKLAGNTPACCYLRFSYLCGVGRPLSIGGHLVLAPLQHAPWG